jgi:exopolyphosphatase/guanosine-5'-triphosphate,3'-diphosphate pyrophosphatase
MILWPKKPPAQVAAVDLGSNSFHMVVAELRARELVMVDRLREMVRLGAGLTPQRFLTPEVQQRALLCLERFGQRLRGFPPDGVRAVGTNALRMARNSSSFLILAEQALGYPIEIIDGIEEARLIYQGVMQNFTLDGKRRLIMDIGGGSTEYIVGVNLEPLYQESLKMGCVSMNLAHFPDGKVNAKRFKRAIIAAEQELEPYQTLFCKTCWNKAVGASGTIRAIRKILVNRKWSKRHITREGLNRLADALLSAGSIDKKHFPDLNPDRYLSFPGGLAILYASFKILEIQEMRVSEGALREGLLEDLKGRIDHDDICSRTVSMVQESGYLGMAGMELLFG